MRWILLFSLSLKKRWEGGKDGREELLDAVIERDGMWLRNLFVCLMFERQKSTSSLFLKVSLSLQRKETFPNFPLIIFPPSELESECVSVGLLPPSSKTFFSETTPFISIHLLFHSRDQQMFTKGRDREEERKKRKEKCGIEWEKRPKCKSVSAQFPAYLSGYSQ